MQTTPLKLRIAHLYPDLLNIYGDMGNVLALQKRASWRDIEVEVVRIESGDTINADDYDLFFAGGGQDNQQALAANELIKNGVELIKAAHCDKPMLAICGSYQLFGKYYLTSDGQKLRGVSIMDIHTQAGEKRFIGNVTATCDFLQIRTIVGFENHSGVTYLGDGVEPLFKVKKGNGNNGLDKTEGARYRNVFGTYLHGPLLPKNPHFCDYLLQLALDVKYKCKMPLLPLDDRIELYAHESRICAKY